MSEALGSALPPAVVINGGCVRAPGVWEFLEFRRMEVPGTSRYHMFFARPWGSPEIVRKSRPDEILHWIGSNGHWNVLGWGPGNLKAPWRPCRWHHGNSQSQAGFVISGNKSWMLQNVVAVSLLTCHFKFRHICANYVYIHPYIPTYLHTYIPTYLPTYIHTYIYIYTRIYT